MKNLVKILTLATFTLMISSAAFAELKPATHSGFYIGLGVGVGSLNLEYDNVDEDFDIFSDSETGGAGNFRIGGALSNKVLFGFEGNAWVKDYDVAFGRDIYPTQVTVSNAAAVITYYPTQYFFIKGGPAIGIAEIDIESPGSSLNYHDEATGGGVMLGLGGELRLTKKFALVPSAQWMWQKIELDDFEDLKANFFSVTLGVGWFW
ncbi:MAG: outer membrane beta-barrel protein [Candidatus Zixiibacteriota bacterium]